MPHYTFDTYKGERTVRAPSEADARAMVESLIYHPDPTKRDDQPYTRERLEQIAATAPPPSPSCRSGNADRGATDAAEPYLTLMNRPRARRPYRRPGASTPPLHIQEKDLMKHPSTPPAETTREAVQQPPRRGFRERLAARLTRRRTRSVPVAKTPASTGTPAGGERIILGVAVAVLLLVAAAAAYVSYQHFYGLAIDLGEKPAEAMLYPAMSDGVIVMASLVILYCSRRGLPVPVLAKVALALGGLVTLASNVAHGWDGGTGSRLLSALAPVAFVGAYELLMWLVRNARRDAEPAVPEVVERVVYRDVPVEAPVEVEVPVLAADRFEAARLVVEDAHRAGRRVPGRRALADRWGIEIREAVEILDAVAQEFAPPAPPEAPAPVPEAPAVPPAAEIPSRKITEEEKARNALSLAGEFPKDNPPTEADMNAAGLTETGKFLVRRVWNMPDPQQAAENVEQADHDLKRSILFAALDGQHAISAPAAEPSDEELFAGMTPAEALSGPGATELRRQWRERAAAANGSTNGRGPAGGAA
ncbi:DUF2637 domain-containing protein [Streptosporangium sp. NPDC050855]|uniref:DUF2637 domain-containing protein n=1 Tax=Streptosporangium sp. NPDC050855 TaxID=3366194 RepID=UPI0037B44E7B